jgi:hypothetical protein
MNTEGRAKSIYLEDDPWGSCLLPPSWGWTLEDERAPSSPSDPWKRSFLIPSSGRILKKSSGYSEKSVVLLFLYMALCGKNDTMKNDHHGNLKCIFWSRTTRSSNMFKDLATTFVIRDYYHTKAWTWNLFKRDVDIGLHIFSSAFLYILQPCRSYGRADHSSKESYCLCKKITKLKKRPGPNKWAVELLMYACMYVCVGHMESWCSFILN